MPRALVPGARSLAAADGPLLPFLAPRVAAESPLRTLISPRPAARHPPRHPPRRPAAPHASASGFLGLRYADIYSFAQTQLARHSTAARTPASRPTPQQPDPSPRRPGRVRPRSRRQQPATSPRVPARAFPTHLQDLRRKRLLKKEEERLERFLSTLHTVGSRRRLSFYGQWRSLQRRIYALRIAKDTQLDLTGKAAWICLPAMAALDYRAYPGRKRVSYKVDIVHDPQAKKLAKAVVYGAVISSQDEMLANWTSFTEAERAASWHLILLYLLDKMPGHALRFVRVLAEGPPLPNLNITVLADALEFIGKLCYHSRNTRHRFSTDESVSRLFPNMSDFIPTFCLVFRQHSARGRCRGTYTQDLFLSLARLSSLDELRHVFDMLVESQAVTGYDTLLHYANCFGKFGDHTYALRCLQRITELASSLDAAQSMVARTRFTWSCAVILRRSMHDKNNYHLTSEIVAQLLKLGVKLDILLYNILMNNAMDAGDDATAFRIYNLLEENEILPTKWTYGILLHGCITAHNPARFDDFADHCAHMARELKDPWLASEYLYYLYVRHKGENSEHRSARLLHAYSQFFSLDPLRPLLPPVDVSMPQEVESMHLLPNTHAIYIMLQLEIRKALSISHTRVWNLYLFFTRLVEENYHPVLNQVATEPVIWNAFLYAFCQGQQFANASQCVKNMTDGKPENHGIPQPNVYSWNIFMQAFFKTDQVRPAERIFDIMKGRGIEPDEYSHGVLLRGYAKAQDIDKIGEAMANIESENELDPQLLKILSNIEDKQKLMLVLDGSVLAKVETARNKVLAKEEQEQEKKRLETELEQTRLAKEKDDGDKAEAEKEERRMRREQPPQFKSLIRRPRLVLLPSTGRRV